MDSVVQNCPIDVRRGLYKNIVLSGGSTMFKVTALKLLCSAITYSLCQDFGKRLERDIKKFVNTRLDATKQLTGQEVQTANGGGNTKLMYCNFSQSQSMSP